MLYLTQKADGVSFERRNVSQLVAIDVTDITRPRVLKRLDIIGELREGVSRKVENTVYVVSHSRRATTSSAIRSERTGGSKPGSMPSTWADPTNPRWRSGALFEGGSAQQGGATSSEGRYFNGIAISATSNTLHVVENWPSYKYDSGTGPAARSTSP